MASDRKKAFQSKCSVTEPVGCELTPQQQAGTIAAWRASRASSFANVVIAIAVVNAVVLVLLVAFQYDACRGDPNATRNLATLVGVIATSLTGLWIAAKRGRKRT